jgi:hypothetical protein
MLAMDCSLQCEGQFLLWRLIGFLLMWLIQAALDEPGHWRPFRGHAAQAGVSPCQHLSPGAHSIWQFFQIVLPVIAHLLHSSPVGIGRRHRHISGGSQGCAPHP